MYPGGHVQSGLWSVTSHIALTPQAQGDVHFPLIQASLSEHSSSL